MHALLSTFDQHFWSDSPRTSPFPKIPTATAQYAPAQVEDGLRRAKVPSPPQDRPGHTCWCGHLVQEVKENRGAARRKACCHVAHGQKRQNHARAATEVSSSTQYIIFTIQARSAIDRSTRHPAAPSSSPPKAGSACRAHALVPRDVDGRDIGQPEVPLQVGVDERRDEASTGGVHVDLDPPAVLGVHAVWGRAVKSEAEREQPLNVSGGRTGITTALHTAQPAPAPPHPATHQPSRRWPGHPQTRQ